MKGDALYKRAFNDTLGIVAELGADEPLPSENALGTRLGVSRTTVRKVLMELATRGLVTETRRTLLLPPEQAAEPYPSAETVPLSAQVETRFMEWILRGGAQPGTSINELDLARQFGVATTGVREFLNRFQRFGLIEKRPSAGWIFKGFTREFALELFEIREMFELRAATAFCALPDASPLWQKLRILRAEHQALLPDVAARFHDFSDLDSRFHRLVTSAAPNRFVDSFYDIITLIFHYHYQWRKHDERQRNEAALREHLAYIDALLSRDLGAVEAACRKHLSTARDTLIRATTSAQ